MNNTGTKKVSHSQGEWSVKDGRILELNNSKVIATISLPLTPMLTNNDTAVEEAEANARRIVKCVNLHDEFVDACKLSLEAFEKLLKTQHGDGAENVYTVTLKELIKKSEQE